MFNFNQVLPWLISDQYLPTTPTKITNQQYDKYSINDVYLGFTIETENETTQIKKIEQSEYIDPFLVQRCSPYKQPYTDLLSEAINRVDKFDRYKEYEYTLRRLSEDRIYYWGVVNSSGYPVLQNGVGVYLGITDPIPFSQIDPSYKYVYQIGSFAPPPARQDFTVLMYKTQLKYDYPPDKPDKVLVTGTYTYPSYVNGSNGYTETKLIDINEIDNELKPFQYLYVGFRNRING